MTFVHCSRVQSLCYLANWSLCFYQPLLASGFFKVHSCLFLIPWVIFLLCNALTLTTKHGHEFYSWVIWFDFGKRLSHLRSRLFENMFCPYFFHEEFQVLLMLWTVFNPVFFLCLKKQSNIFLLVVVHEMKLRLGLSKLDLYNFLPAETHKSLH